MPAPQPLLGIKDCVNSIQQFLVQEMGSLRRLKELLPVYFDLHQVYTLEAQREILRACNLVPIQEKFRVTFSLETGIGPQATTSGSDPLRNSSQMMRM